MKKYILIVILAISYFNCYSKVDSSKYVIIEDLSNDWQVYDKHYQSYIPLLDKQQPIQSGGVFLDADINASYLLSFYSTSGLSIFVENKLIYKHPTNQHSFRARIPIAELKKNANQDYYLVLFYNTNSSLYIDSLCVQSPLSNINIEARLGWVQASFLRTYVNNNSAIIYSILLFSIVLVFYKYIFMKGRTLINIGIDRNTELLLLDRSGLMSVTLIIINSLLYMILFLIFLQGKTIYFNFPFKFPFSNNTSLYIYYLFSTFALMQILKVIYIKTINELTFPSGVSPLQNYLLLNYLFQTGLIILPALLFVRALLSVDYLIIVANYAAISFFFILVIISLLTSYMIYSRSELRNIYLFSYICTAEVVPLIIAYRFLLG